MKKKQNWGEQFTETMKKLNKKEQKTFINDLTTLFKKTNEELTIKLNDKKRKSSKQSTKNDTLRHNLNIEHKGV